MLCVGNRPRINISWEGIALPERRDLSYQAKREITLAMLKRRAKCKASCHCIRRALQRRNIVFRRMRAKPILTDADRRARFAFAKKYRTMSKAWWVKNVHMHIDMKTFTAYVNAAARDVAALRTVRGAYRQLGQGLDEAYVVVPKALRYNPGAKPIKVLAGVGRGRVRVWHVVEGKWCGSAAARAYEGPLLQGLRRAWPRKRKFQVLEDNDPTGFKARAGVQAKAAVGIKAFEIPKRSPDLNVCDYALWAAVNRKMRRQEKKFPRAKRETRAEHIARLRRAAHSLTPAFINKSIGDMRRRCRLLFERQGGLFEEGGRPTQP